MARNLRILVLVLAALLATSAISASPSWATVFTAEKYPAALDGAPVEGESTTFKFGSIDAKCTLATPQGEIHTVENKATSTLTITRSYSECTWKILGVTFLVTVRMNGCAFLLHAEAGGPPFNAAVDIECVTGGKMEILVYQSQAKDNAGEPACIATVSAQNGLKSVGLINKAGEPPHIELKPNVTNIAYEIDGSATLCGTGGANGTYTGNTTVKGTSGGAAIGISVS